MYEKEVVDQEAKIEKMKAEGKDEHDIKKQVIKSTSVCDQCAYYPLQGRGLYQIGHHLRENCSMAGRAGGRVGRWAVMAVDS